MPKSNHIVKTKTVAEKLELLKWCRKAFGKRGIGWDFSPAVRGAIMISIWDDRYEVMWQMWRE